MLTYLLKRAIPGVRVESVRIFSSPSPAASLTTKLVYWIQVVPNHDRYWRQFKKRYPNSESLALNYGANVDIYSCPEFPTRGDLIRWLADTLELTWGERKLLHLCNIERL